ncbi:undecaprenyl/decaprenyl-phosphate alpha-N-acetylglucosaminyl 1-phosphate transferase [Streptomyces sp. SID13666]|uniref:MraY family glycosyltransferase n=1 Tax=Streptomyces TaxID=1883 RepID=UPI001105E46C|nr:MULTISPECIES: MraY family glycosyltransferase [Streptomyces]NEA54920.1 undecaprenyl/decaprenyl-phosphate alpha-N-acetylglucosaminyl 1-phosphate transferase [Streptomyces sp. SID13666]NEA70722.1 undecaprenyl/decaprenyl-phosphate alpha-N-acetylglucosaminyl 1-phosphate transferase [Streptomyces sp. SID13588]MCM2421670.1 undecaprenyl/decaprenyl-phosphate alpha-N-acetylglucosaminyl 1-phosphate transferase [Streptomyces sp. RKAG293]MCM2426128.1 undecaprenyl/decaprenyl-phosphate alpha-N-acetylgluco
MREYLLTLCVTAAVTYLLTGPVRKFAIAAGAMPEIRERDVHREPTPRLGGIAMFGGLCAGLLVSSHLWNLSSVFELSNEPRALLSGAGLIWLLGVLDDKWGVDALIKLGAQMIAAGVMVLQGLTILWLPVPGVGTVSLSPIQSTLLTVALVVITINAVNFVDGLDGLASGMVAIAAIAFFMYAYRMWYGYGVEAAAPATLFSAILIGMCLGFLPHNLHPARIFMGDSGSMLIGLVLASSAISITGQVDPDAITDMTGSTRETVHFMVPVYMPLLLPLTLIAIPAADLVLAIVRRTWNGQSPFAADRGHLHHRLLEIGHSHSRAVLIMYFWSALIAFGAVAFSLNSSSLWIVLVIMVLSAVGLVVLLLPRFRPRAPRWAEAFVPPRYRRKRRTTQAAQLAAEQLIRAGGAAGVHGSTAIGDRSRLPDRRPVDSRR